jgi:Arsenate reductase and related proteins, glutaredoxin family
VDVIIYHNPNCGTSRNTLAMIRNAGIEPHIRIPQGAAEPCDARAAHRRMGITVRALLPYAELGLGDASLTDDQLLDAMLAYPILINRPIVVSPNGVRLCRPSEEVLDLLPSQQGEFIKEDGERVVDERGRRIATA